MSTIEDERLSIGYEVIHNSTAGIAELLRTHGVLRTEAIVLRCESSVASAGAMLALMELGQSTVLEPMDAADFPGFCQYVATASVHLDHGAHRISLELRTNVRWRDQELALNRSHIYVRTSGTRGSSKIVAFDRDKLKLNAQNVQQRFRFCSKDRVVIPVPIHHMYGLGVGLLPAFFAKAPIRLLDHPNAVRYLEMERAFLPTVALLAAPLLATISRIRRDHRAYRLTIVAGDKLQGDTFLRYAEKVGCITQLYGSTEMGAMTAADPSESQAVRMNTCGSPLPGVSCKVDSDSGELLCHHPYGFDGYVGENGDHEPCPNWFSTGDLASIDEKQRITILGRTNQRIKRDGVWLHLSEVEEGLLSLNGIEHVVVVATGETMRGVGLTAFCKPLEGTNITSGALRSMCAQVLPRHAFPDAIEVIDVFPQLPSGKLDRRSLELRADDLLKSRRC